MRGVTYALLCSNIKWRQKNIHYLQTYELLTETKISVVCRRKSRYSLQTLLRKDTQNPCQTAGLNMFNPEPDLAKTVDQAPRDLHGALQCCGSSTGWHKMGLSVKS